MRRVVAVVHRHRRVVVKQQAALAQSVQRIDDGRLHIAYRRDDAVIHRIERIQALHFTGMEHAIYKRFHQTAVLAEQRHLGAGISLVDTQIHGGLFVSLYIGL